VALSLGIAFLLFPFFHIGWSFLTIPAIYRRDKPLPLTGQKPFFTNWLFSFSHFVTLDQGPAIAATTAATAKSPA
jgi:hypothetical protein